MAAVLLGVEEAVGDGERADALDHAFQGVPRLAVLYPPAFSSISEEMT